MIEITREDFSFLITETVGNLMKDLYEYSNYTSEDDLKRVKALIEKHGLDGLELEHEWIIAQLAEALTRTPRNAF